jgi:hypothetical protein
MWVTPDHYRVYEIETGREENFLIPRTDLLENTERNELIHALNEKAEVAFKTLPLPPLTKHQQNDLGATLKEIRVSKTRQTAVGHSKWWEGANR